MEESEEKSKREPFSFSKKRRARSSTHLRPCLMYASLGSGAGPATADPVTAASAALAAAFRESAVACTALASSSASDEATCRAASSAAQAALARARAAMRDLELLAEETDM
jgi:hypothetical protein